MSGGAPCGRGVCRAAAVARRAGASGDMDLTLRGNWSTAFLYDILPQALGGFWRFSEIPVRTK